MNSIIVNLTKENMVYLICGHEPSDKLFNQLTKLGYGYFIGGHVCEWKWERVSLRQKHIKELYDLFLTLKTHRME